MKMEITMNKQDVRSLKNFMDDGFDKFEEFVRNPDPTQKESLLRFISQARIEMVDFFGGVESISMTIDKKLQ